MSIRTIRVEGDEILRKKSKEIKEMTPRLSQLIDDMIDTMYESEGVGLAAPQVGILKRVVVIDVGEGPIVFINPEITAQSGSQTGYEGCLSVPGKSGVVTRPNVVTVKALDREMKEFTLTGTELMARAICHECAHLDGQLYTEVADRMLTNEELEELMKEDDEE